MNFINPLRVLNYLLLVCGYLLSRITGRVFHFGKPAAVSIEPTNRCNLHCPECPSGMKELNRASGIMNPVFFRTVIDQLSPELAWLNLYFQGEPYLNPHFFDLASYARSKGIYVSSSTNGHFLDKQNAEATVKSGLNRLIISVDGTDQQTYESYRIGGSLTKVVEGIKHLAQARKKAGSRYPKIIVQFLVLKSNERQVGDIRKLGIEWGADKVEIKTAQFNDYEQGNPLMPAEGKYTRYRMQDARSVMQDAGCGMKVEGMKVEGMKVEGMKDEGMKGVGSGMRYGIKNGLPNHCFRMWSGCVVTWDGKVVPCCFDKDATHLLGELNKESFMTIWKGKEYNIIRRKIMKERKTIAICRNCTEGIGLSRWL